MNSKVFWEVIGYITLFGLITAQIIVGYWYLVAQSIYLLCNIAVTVRCFAIHQAPADKVKNITFTAITVGLIIIKIVLGG